jgi:hypothetical protein
VIQVEEEEKDGEEEERTLTTRDGGERRDRMKAQAQGLSAPAAEERREEKSL